MNEEYDTTCSRCGEREDKHYQVRVEKIVGDYYTHKETVTVYMCVTALYQPIGYPEKANS